MMAKISVPPPILRLFVLVTFSISIVEVLLRLINSYGVTLIRPYHLEDFYPTELLEGQHWLDGDSFYLYKRNASGTTHGHDVQVNRWGLRGKDFFEREVEGNNTFRIMVLGDSVTMGIGVAEQDRYTEVLETLLRMKHPKAKIEVINLGVHGFATVQEVKMLRRMWDVIQPNLVVVGFCANDPSITHTYMPPYHIPTPDVLRWYLNHLLTYRIADILYDRVYRKWNHYPSPWEESMLAYNTDSHDWEVFEKSVKEIGDFVVGHTGTNPIVLYLHEPEKVRSEDKDGEARYTSVRRTFEKTNFIWVEMDSAFHEVGVSKFESHPNEETHKYYARVLAEKIEDLQLLTNVPR